MTVAELIEHLQTLDQSMRVLAKDDYIGYCDIEVEQIAAVHSANCEDRWFMDSSGMEKNAEPCCLIEQKY